MQQGILFLIHRLFVCIFFFVFNLYLTVFFIAFYPSTYLGHQIVNNNAGVLWLFWIVLAQSSQGLTWHMISSLLPPSDLLWSLGIFQFFLCHSEFSLILQAAWICPKCIPTARTPYSTPFNEYLTYLTTFLSIKITTKVSCWLHSLITGTYSSASHFL